MRINNNLSALSAYNNLNLTNNALQKSITELSTGLRINSASDDAAGFAISEKMRSQIRGLDTALRNSQDGISLLQTAEGALGETNSMLHRMRELAVQASNDSLTSQDRQYIQLEIDELRDQIDRIAETTQFNKKRILDGSSGAVWSSSDSNISVKINGGLTYIDNFGQKVSAEGNYRIEIKASPGEAQVQKSNIMLIKHKNVTMDRVINMNAGINNVRVENVPAGYYHITSELPTEARAIATGVYGMTFSELDEALSASARNSMLTSNASILFGVTNVDTDSGTITVNAIANILNTDGTADTVVQNNIVLTEGKFKDLSEVFGVGVSGTDDTSADGAFELKLEAGGAGKFERGDKFVYNLNVSDGTNGADRVIKFTNVQNTDWPEHWEETEEIYKTNSFIYPQHVSASAKVLFLIDASGSMRGPISQVASNIEAFINKIKTEDRVDTVQIGVVGYLEHPVDVATHGSIGTSVSWTDDPTTAASVLSFSPWGGDVDAYLSIKETVEALKADMSDVQSKHIVLVTDTCQETADRPYGYKVVPKYTTAQLDALRNDTIRALQDAGIMFSAIRPDDVGSGIMRYYAAASDQAMKDFNPIVEATKGVSLDEGSATWGNELSTRLAERITEDAVDKAVLSDTPLYEFDAFSSIFTGSSGPSVTLTITQDGTSTDIEVGPMDTLQSLAEKIDAVTGSETTAEFINDEDNNDRGIVLRTNIKSGSGIKFSGDEDFIHELGLRSNFGLEFSLDSSKVTDMDIHFRNFYLNSKDGTVYNGDIVMKTNEKELSESAKLTDFEAAYIGQIPKRDVKLRDLKQFWDSQGVFMVENAQKITITQGDGQTADITLYATDTLEDVRIKMNDAIANELGQLKHADKSEFVSFVTENSASSYGDESVAGTFIVRSAVSGKVGELYFSGSDEILNALGFNTIHESSETEFTSSVYNAHSGVAVSVGVKATGNLFKHVIPPMVDLEVNAMAGVSAKWDETTKRFLMIEEEYSAFIHLKDESITFQTGSNQGEDFVIQIGDTSCNALGIEGVNVLTRETASKAITTIDSAINKISSQRAKIGAYQNALEHTMINLTTTSTNLTSAESGIRDTDMSKAMMEFVKLQILNQSGTSMIAQANQFPQSVLSLMQ